MDRGPGTHHAAGIDPIYILEHVIIAVKSTRQTAHFHQVFLDDAEIHLHVVHAFGDFAIQFDGFLIEGYTEFMIKLAGNLLIMIDRLPAAAVLGIRQHQQPVNLFLKRLYTIDVSQT